MKVEAIAQRYDLAPSRVWEIIRDARADVAAEQALDNPPPVAAKDSQATQKPRMSRRILLDRAWKALDLLPFKSFGDGMQMTWLRAVVAIHECSDDGATLRFAPRSFFHHLADFAQALGRTEAEMAAFFDRGVLLEVDGGGVALPSNLDLLPRVPSQTRAPHVSVREQRGMLTVLTGGRSELNAGPSDSWKTPPLTPGISPISPESDSWKTPDMTPGISPISPESDEVARVAAAAANAKDNCDLAAAAVTGAKVLARPSVRQVGTCL